MEALGRKEEAQAFRWSCFERTLNDAHLRDYLKRLPEFEDIEAEQRAMATALGFPDIHQALVFLISWPALERAAALVLGRATELNGDHYEVLSPAADALAGKHPLAATLLLRSMIDFALKQNRVKRYRHAARHLAECASLASAIGDFGGFEPHERYTHKNRRYGYGAVDSKRLNDRVCTCERTFNRALIACNADSFALLEMFGNEENESVERGLELGQVKACLL
jgi:hypothetical protein